MKQFINNHMFNFNILFLFASNKSFTAGGGNIPSFIYFFHLQFHLKILQAIF